MLKGRALPGAGYVTATAKRLGEDKFFSGAFDVFRNISAIFFVFCLVEKIYFVYLQPEKGVVPTNNHKYKLRI